MWGVGGECVHVCGVGGDCELWGGRVVSVCGVGGDCELWGGRVVSVYDFRLVKRSSKEIGGQES